MSENNLWFNVEGEVVHPNASRGGGGPGRFKSAVPLGFAAEKDDDVPHPFSPDGRNRALDHDEAVQLTDGDAGATPDEVPTFASTTGVPKDVKADSVEDFIQGSNSAMGDGGEVGHMQPNIDTDFEFDEKSNKVLKVNMKVTTQIVRPRAVLGRVKTDTEKALIKKAEGLIKSHEEKHRDIAKDFMTRACKEMRGKTVSKAQEILKDYIKKMDKAQADFDAKEGQIDVVYGDGTDKPATDVKTGPIKPAPKP